MRHIDQHSSDSCIVSIDHQRENAILHLACHTRLACQQHIPLLVLLLWLCYRIRHVLVFLVVLARLLYVYIVADGRVKYRYYCE